MRKVEAGMLDYFMCEEELGLRRLFYIFSWDIKKTGFNVSIYI